MSSIAFTSSEILQCFDSVDTNENSALFFEEDELSNDRFKIF